MNKPNKSLVAMRKAGLWEATAFAQEQKTSADKYLRDACRYAEARAEASTYQLLRSYQLGLRGIRIGQEAHFETAR